ncbi:hypothetical protein [Burkholderia ubonensis]|uniref:hypothetical protein n=1 Tax=Burkholderia ubonensis TaxID=101571 RepID=UPI001E52486E|nr:hypothetical protein [Burkholderia ubonensis]
MKFSPVTSSVAQPQVFFPTPDMYFAVHYEPRPDCKNWGNVLCERHSEGKAICGYLSPIDAMLEAVFSSRPGKRFEVIPAQKFDPSVFINDYQGRLALDVHLGWLARDGQLIARPSGKPVACAVHHEILVPPEHVHHVAFTVEADTVAILERLYRSAGLVSYKETFAIAQGWPRARRDRIVSNSIRKVSSLAPAGTEYNQVAVFDPEFEQWHFVPAAQLESGEASPPGAAE